MKKSFLLLAFICMTLATYAVPKVLTVYNGTGKNAQYTSLDAAIAVANTEIGDVDTIILYGSPNAYSITGSAISKKLIIIGPGWSPNNNGTGNDTAKIAGDVYISSPITFEGIAFTTGNCHLYTVSAGTKFIRCTFANTIQWEQSCDDIEVRGCCFPANTWLWAKNNAVVSNFIFVNNYVYVTYGWFSGFNNPSNSNIRIDHNLFYCQNGYSNTVFNGCTKFTITNNIFGLVNFNVGISNFTFSNNVFYGNSGGSSIQTVNGNSDAGGNLIDSSPLTVSSLFIWGADTRGLADYSLTANSPAKGKASDGKDIGLLYDAAGPDNFSNCRLSRLPYVSNAVIPITTVPLGTDVIINVEGKVAD